MAVNPYYTPSYRPCKSSLIPSCCPIDLVFGAGMVDPKLLRLPMSDGDHNRVQMSTCTAAARDLPDVAIDAFSEK